MEKSDILFKFLHQLCASTSAWNCFIVRNWGSRRWSWRRPRWTWWVHHKPNRKTTGKAKMSTRRQRTAQFLLSTWIHNMLSTPFRGNTSFLLRSWVGNWLRSYTEMLQAKSTVGFFFFFFTFNYVQKLISVSALNFTISKITITK